MDLTTLNPKTTRVICTDFGATLDLSAIEKGMCSVNNHAVICISFVCYDWRVVKIRKETSNELEWDEIIINDYDKWICFGNTLSKGKKNDHVFYNAWISHIIDFTTIN